MNNMKKVAYTGAGLGLLAFNNVNAAIDSGVGGPYGNPITKEGSLVTTIETWISVLLTLLYIVAVVYGLWGGFNILTAAGDEEKVKKGKTILINAVIGLVVIFLVGLIIRFVLGLLQNNVVTNQFNND